MSEMRRFQDYLASRNITFDNILEHSAEVERQITANVDGGSITNAGDTQIEVVDDDAQQRRLEEANARWGPDIYLCDEAIQYLVR